MTRSCASHDPLPAIPELSGTSLAGLSLREREIAVLVAEGRSNKEIARALAISFHTVSTHLRRVFVKLGINSRVELCRFVVSHLRQPPPLPFAIPAPAAAMVAPVLRRAG